MGEVGEQELTEEADEEDERIVGLYSASDSGVRYRGMTPVLLR